MRAQAFIGHNLTFPLHHWVSTQLPPRIALQVPEIPIAMMFVAYYVKFLLLHVQWLIPIVLYHRLWRADAPSTAAAAAEGGTTSAPEVAVDAA